jgi:hypothetical protein
MRRRTFLASLAALCAPLPALSASPRSWTLVKEMTAQFDWGEQTGLAWEVEFEGRRYRHAARFLTSDEGGPSRARTMLHAYFNKTLLGAGHVS